MRKILCYLTGRFCYTDKPCCGSYTHSCSVRVKDLYSSMNQVSLFLIRRIILAFNRDAYLGQMSL